MKIARMVFGLVLAFFVVGLVGKGLAFAIGIAGSLLISPDNQTAHDDLDAAANIFGLLGGLYVASRCYRWITREPHSDADAAPARQ